MFYTLCNNNNNMNLGTECGTFHVIGEFAKNVYLLDSSSDSTGKFNFASNIINPFLSGHCSNLAETLTEKMNGYNKSNLAKRWSIYSVFIGTYDVPVHYIAGTANGNIFIDIMGVFSKNQVVTQWTKYAKDNDMDSTANFYFQNTAVIIKKTGNAWDNPDYECINSDKTDNVVQQILDILNDRFKILKIVQSTPKDHNKHSLYRIACSYKLLATIGCGPSIETFLCNNVLVVLMQFLPITSSNELNEMHKIQITKLVKKMHKLGIYHGDLHGSNIAYDSNMKPFVIDAETLFFESEVTSNMIVKKWLKDGFGMTFDEFKEHEENTGWRFICTDV